MGQSTPLRSGEGVHYGDSALELDGSMLVADRRADRFVNSLVDRWISSAVLWLRLRGLAEVQRRPNVT
jgi:hypothetical protein